MLLLHDMADGCHVGDCVEITGVVMLQPQGPVATGALHHVLLLCACISHTILMESALHRGGTYTPCCLRVAHPHPGERAGGVPKMRHVLQARHVRLTQGAASPSTALVPAQDHEFLHFWRDHATAPLVARNALVASLCPHLCSLFDVKLAALLTLLGGVSTEQAQARTRGDSHLLLVGDPGTGKSRIMQDAAALASRCALALACVNDCWGFTKPSILNVLTHRSFPARRAKRRRRAGRCA